VSDDIVQDRPRPKRSARERTRLAIMEKVTLRSAICDPARACRERIAILRESFLAPKPVDAEDAWVHDSFETIFRVAEQMIEREFSTTAQHLVLVLELALFGAGAGRNLGRYNQTLRRATYDLTALIRPESMPYNDAGAEEDDDEEEDA
jgi:hypothetical protein